MEPLRTSQVRSTPGLSKEDELETLRRENVSLKRANLEQGDKVRQLGIKMTRIRHGLQQQATPKDAPPVLQARAKQALSKDDQIAELQMQISQREMREVRLARELKLARLTGSASARGPQQKRLVRQAAAPRSAARVRPRQSSPAGTPEATPAMHSEQAAAGGATAGGLVASTSLESGEFATARAQGASVVEAELHVLRQLLQEKDAKLSVLEQQQQLQDQTPHSSAQLAAAALRSEQESAQLLELRRNLKDRTAQLTLLTQRYDHLNGRFESVRDNHEKALAQMDELNRVILAERSEGSKLRQELQHAQLLQEELSEKTLHIEQLMGEKASLEDENRAILAKAFSEAEAGEVSTLKQALFERDAELKRLRRQLATLEEEKKSEREALIGAESRLASTNTERDLAKADLQRLRGAHERRLEEVAALKKRVALLDGDTGVSAEELERALALVRQSATPASGEEMQKLRLQETDLELLGLPPMAKRQVVDLLLENNELTMSLEKTEQLLEISQKMSDVLRADLDGLKRNAEAERAKLHKQLAMTAAKLADSNMNELRQSEAIAALRERRLGGPNPLAAIDDGASVCDSLISAGATSELNVAADENVFELRVVSASLQPGFFSALPTTFVSFDFFQHDTQATPMRQGLQPEFDLTAQFVLSVDDLFLHYASTQAIKLELYQSWGVECQLVARCDAPLRELLHSRRVSKCAQLFSVPREGASAAHSASEPRAVGTIVYEMRMRRRMELAVHSFLQRFPEVAPLALTPVLPSSKSKEVILKVVSCEGLRLRAHGLPSAPYVHFALYEFGEQETAASAGSTPTFLQEFRFEVDFDLSFKEYLQQSSVQFSVFDENDEQAGAMIGFALLPLAPLLGSPRLERLLPLQDTALQPAGHLSVSVELRDSAKARPVSLSLPPEGKVRAEGGPSALAALRIQSSYRGSQVRRQRARTLRSSAGAAKPAEPTAPAATAAAGVAPAARQGEAAVSLGVNVHTLELDEEVRVAEGLTTLWVETEFLGLAPTPIASRRLTPKEAATALDFAHEVQLRAGSPEALKLREALLSAEPAASQLTLRVQGLGSGGTTKLVGTGLLELKKLWSAGHDAVRTAIVIKHDKKPEFTSLGTLRVSLRLLEAAHRATHPEAIRISIGELSAASGEAPWASVESGQLWVEVDLLGLGSEVKGSELSLCSRRVDVGAVAAAAAAGSALEFGMSRLVETKAGSQTRARLQEALRSEEEEDSDVYFILKSDGDAELAEGYLNLEAMLRNGEDKVNFPLELISKDGKKASLAVSVLAIEALQRLSQSTAS